MMASLSEKITHPISSYIFTSAGSSAIYNKTVIGASKRMCYIMKLVEASLELSGILPRERALAP